jgi:hypothetical protein
MAGVIRWRDVNGPSHMVAGDKGGYEWKTSRHKWDWDIRRGWHGGGNTIVFPIFHACTVEQVLGRWWWQLDGRSRWRDRGFRQWHGGFPTFFSFFFFRKRKKKGEDYDFCTTRRLNSWCSKCGRRRLRRGSTRIRWWWSIIWCCECSL